MKYKAIQVTDSCDICYSIEREDGYVLCSLLLKEDAERIAHALKCEELFEEMAEFINKTERFQCDCEYTMPRWQHRISCPVVGAKTLLTKIEAAEKEGKI